MPSTKSDVMELIRKLPEHVTTFDIMEELYFREQVEAGLKDLAEGRVLSHDALKRRIARWRESAGR